jgi:hypothetical protein
MNLAERARKLADELEHLVRQFRECGMTAHGGVQPQYTQRSPNQLRYLANEWEELHPLVDCPHCPGHANGLMRCPRCRDTGKVRKP